MIDRDTIIELQAIRQAEQETGISGKSSVGATYAAALRQMGMDTKGMPGAAAKAVYTALKNKRRVKAAITGVRFADLGSPIIGG
jgi:hypothetical protein